MGGNVLALRGMALAEEDLWAHGLKRCAAGGLMIFVGALVVAACGADQTTATSSSSAASSSPTSATAERTCSDGGQDPHQASPDFYQGQYADGLAKQLKQKLSVYDSAVESGDPQQIGTAAGDLYSEVKSDVTMTESSNLFGCYDQAVQTGLQSATDAFATTLDDMACAAANTCSRTQADMPGLLAQAKPQEKTYVEAINAYASRFGGEQIPQ